EHRVLDPAGVDDRLVADRHVLADHGGEPAQLRVRPVVADVDHGAVLDIAARADADEVDVAADHRLRPHRHVVSQLHVADHAGVGIDVDPRAERRKDVAIRPDTVHPPIVGRVPTRLPPTASRNAVGGPAPWPRDGADGRWRPPYPVRARIVGQWTPPTRLLPNCAPPSTACATPGGATVPTRASAWTTSTACATPSRPAASPCSPRSAPT